MFCGAANTSRTLCRFPSAERKLKFFETDSNWNNPWTSIQRITNQQQQTQHMKMKYIIIDCHSTNKQIESSEFKIRFAKNIPYSIGRFRSLFLIQWANAPIQNSDWLSTSLNRHFLPFIHSSIHQFANVLRETLRNEQINCKHFVRLRGRVRMKK